MKRVGLILPMGDCHCCVHDETCKIIKNTLTNHYLFRCPLVIEVDDDNYPKIKEDGWEFLEEQRDWVFKLLIHHKRG